MAGQPPKPPHPELVALGQRLARLRKARGFPTQASLAAACGMDTSQFQAIESAAKEPRYRTLLRIARALDVDPALLVSDIYPSDAPLVQARPGTDWKKLQDAAEEWLRVCADMTAYHEGFKRPAPPHPPAGRRRPARR